MHYTVFSGKVSHLSLHYKTEMVWFRACAGTLSMEAQATHDEE